MTNRISGDLVLPGDGFGLVEGVFRQYLQDQDAKKRQPNIAFNCHAWAYEQNQAWGRLEDEFKKLGQHSNYWYCTQNEYGAYRYQWRESKITNITFDKGTMILDLVRPSAIDAGQAIPLTLKVTGPNFDNTTLRINDQITPPDARSENTLIFSVPYPITQGDPKIIDAIYGTSELSTSKKFPFLEAKLERNDAKKTITLLFTNTGSTLTDVVLTYRLGLEATPGIIRKIIPKIPNNKKIEDVVTLEHLDRSLKYVEGETIGTVQIDFVHEGTRKRLFIVNTIKHSPADSAENYPAGNMLLMESDDPKLGFDSDLVAKAVRRPNARYLFPDGRIMRWRRSEIPGIDVNRELVGVPENSLLSTILISPTERQVRIICVGYDDVWLNGYAVDITRPVSLNKGKNHLIILVRRSALYLAVVNPQTGRGMQEVVYCLPWTEKEEQTDVRVEPKGPISMFITDWLICGPFPNPGVRPHLKGFDIDYLKNSGGETSKTITPSKGSAIHWEGKTYPWKFYRSSEPRIDILKSIGITQPTEMNNILIYAACYLISDRDRDILIGMGSDDGYKLFF